MTFSINKNNYDYYKRVFSIIWDEVSTDLLKEISKNSSPIEVLSKWEQEKPSLARGGLKEGLLDGLNLLQGFSEEKIKSLDIKLENENLFNTKKLFAIIKDIKNKVIKNKKIKNDYEYYALKELVIDLTNDLNDEERNELDYLISNYENQKC